MCSKKLLKKGTSQNSFTQVALRLVQKSGQINRKDRANLEQSRAQCPPRMCFMKLQCWESWQPLGDTSLRNTTSLLETIIQLACMSVHLRQKPWMLGWCRLYRPCSECYAQHTLFKNLLFAWLLKRGQSTIVHSWHSSGMFAVLLGRPSWKHLGLRTLRSHGRFTTVQTSACSWALAAQTDSHICEGNAFWKRNKLLTTAQQYIHNTFIIYELLSSEVNFTSCWET